MAYISKPKSARWTKASSFLEPRREWGGTKPPFPCLFHILEILVSERLGNLPKFLKFPRELRFSWLPMVLTSCLSQLSFSTLPQGIVKNSRRISLQLVQSNIDFSISPFNSIDLLYAFEALLLGAYIFRIFIFSWKIKPFIITYCFFFFLIVFHALISALLDVISIVIPTLFY